MAAWPFRDDAALRPADQHCVRLCFSFDRQSAAPRRPAIFSAADYFYAGAWLAHAPIFPLIVYQAFAESRNLGELADASTCRSFSDCRTDYLAGLERGLPPAARECECRRADVNGFVFCFNPTARIDGRLFLWMGNKSNCAKTRLRANIAPMANVLPYRN